MNWLNPRDIDPSGHDPDESVDRFVRDNGNLGLVALEAWNAVDPLHCLSMPDEYLSYAGRFIGALRATLPEDRSLYLVEELVRRSFSPSQVCFVPEMGQPWVSPEDIEAIAQLIASSDLLLEESP